MAVYTPVTEAQLVAFLTDYSVGTLSAYSGIESGIENTNFYVQTSQNRFVLTLYERLAREQLPFYLDLMHHLAAGGTPCPDPVANLGGQTLGMLNGKPATLVTCLPGKAQMQPDPAHCAAVGTLLAKMHLQARSFTGTQPNLRGLDWWRKTVPKLAPLITVRARQLLEDEMATQTTFATSASYARLPTSAVHADLFRDNVLFADSDGQATVGGVIDFYFAGVDTWIFDLAVTANDWCTVDRSGNFDTERLVALLSAYRQVRPVNRDEQLGWPYALRAAALRFWISRLDDAVSPRPAQSLTPKDPQHFERILMARRQDAVTVGQALLSG